MDSFVVLYMNNTHYQMAMVAGSKNFSLEGPSVFLFDKSRKLIAKGEKALKKYKNPVLSGVFALQSNLALLDFEWININKETIEVRDMELPCYDGKSLKAVDAFAEIFTVFHDEAKKLLVDSENKQLRFTIIVAAEIPIQSWDILEEAMRKETFQSIKVTLLDEYKAAFKAFAVDYDKCTRESDKTRIGYGEVDAVESMDKSTDDYVVVVSITADSSVFSFFAKEEDGRWEENKNRERPSATLSETVIQSSLKALLSNLIDEHKWKTYSKAGPRLLKALTRTDSSKWKDIKVSDSLIQGRKLEFSSEQISAAFSPIQDAFLKNVQSSSFAQTRSGEKETSIDVIVLGGFHCLENLDITGLKILTHVDMVNGNLIEMQTKKEPVKISLEVCKDMTYSYQASYPVPNLVHLQIDQTIDGKSLESMPVKEKDYMWSESEVLRFSGNHRKLRFHGKIKVQEPIPVTFELFDTCGIEDKTFHVFTWNKDRWKTSKLDTKESMVKFDLHLNSTFYLTSKSILKRMDLDPSVCNIYTGEDKNCTLRFDAGCFSDRTNIECKVIGVRQERMKQRDTLDVLSITKGIRVDLDDGLELCKAVDIQLPFVHFYTDEVGDDDKETVLFEISDDGDINLLDGQENNFFFTGGCIRFQATHFSTKGAAIIRSQSRDSFQSEISRSYNGKSGYRILTLIKQNNLDIDVWFAIYETDKYTKLRNRFIEEKRSHNFKEITGSNSSEIFLKDGCLLRFFITEGAKNISHAYHKLCGGSDYNLKLLKIKPTFLNHNFAECRVMRTSEKGKPEVLLAFPFDISHAITAKRKCSTREDMKGFRQQATLYRRSSCPVSSYGSRTGRNCSSQHTGKQEWLNEKILIELAQKLEKRDIWQLGIFLEIESNKIHQIEQDFPNDLSMYAFEMLKHWKRSRSQQPENHQVKFLENQLKEIERNDLAKSLHDAYYLKNGRLF